MVWVYFIRRVVLLETTGTCTVAHLVGILAVSVGVRSRGDAGIERNGGETARGGCGTAETSDSSREMFGELSEVAGRSMRIPAISGVRSSSGYLSI